VVAIHVSAAAQAFEALYQETVKQVSAFAAHHNLSAAGPLMGVFCEDPADPDCDCDFAVAFPTDSQLKAYEPVEVYMLPAVENMATCILPGSYSADEADEVYERVIAWIEDHHYRIDGPYRELYHPFGEGPHASESVVEIQFPIIQLAGPS